MDHVFGDLVGKNMFLYIDDVVVCGDTKEEVLALFLEKVLQRQDGIKGIKVSVVVRIKVHNKSVKSVTEAAPRTNKAELQSFVGLVGYLRSLIPRYAEHTARMCELLKNVQYEWIDGLQLDFDGLKQAVTNTAALHASRPGNRYEVCTDGSGVGMGAALMQEQDGQEVPLEYTSQRDGRIVEAATGRGYIPGALREKVIRSLHCGRGGAHMGVTKTARIVAQYFVWPGMPADVAAFVKSCLICARLKQPRSPTRRYEMEHLDTAAALTFVSLDHMGPITYESVRLDRSLEWCRGQETVQRAS
ncbi:putative Gag-pol polyprotein [Gregarina niphandrodes]|uniref:Gag-pol polyprotein n=1 Tax=Gregarina niphandrodes TaxID=110365 RepID=A0A023B8J5_GRENI|nr:putative Gag-pol polyprotein [Gregarina niphandrodes]EZG69034.1 putative Gag-pol polyprotein [Gregarina niphandrodes]|eukprot:XP_011134505.1 putative Gag-pol polyprotein [Gregarina niphandrodes]